MNSDTCKKIEMAVPFLIQYFELEKDEQAWIYPALDKAIKSTIEILNLVIDSSLTYEEIAQDLGINSNTVTQKINALGNGGFPLDIRPDKALYAPSRKRNLVRRVDKFAFVRPDGESLEQFYKIGANEMRKKPAVFLDVDGTLTGTKSGEPFKQHPRDVEVLPGVTEALEFHKKQGYRLIGVSNQGGVPQYKTLERTVAEMEYTLDLLPDLELIIFAPGFSGDECYIVTTPLDWNKARMENTSHVIGVIRTEKYESFRKPSWGMLQVIEKIDLDNSWMVGDRPEDEGCATAAGLNFMWAHDWLTHFLGLNPAPEDLKLIQFLEVESVSF